MSVKPQQQRTRAATRPRLVKGLDNDVELSARCIQTSLIADKEGQREAAVQSVLTINRGRGSTQQMQDKERLHTAVLLSGSCGMAAHDIIWPRPLLYSSLATDQILAQAWTRFDLNVCIPACNNCACHEKNAVYCCPPIPLLTRFV